MKDGLSQAALLRLAQSLHAAHSSFPADSFVRACMRGLKPLELKARVRKVSDQLAQDLPESYPEALKIIVASHAHWQAGQPDDSFAIFAAWPLLDYIERFGVDDFQRSMTALKNLTGLFSGEFAIRPYIERYPERAFARLEKFAGDRDEHVRRLASEGCRPRLPWAPQLPALIAEPKPVLELLEALKDDPSLYVRRSVANNLNDIAKDHPERVIELGERWLGGDPSKERRWIIERATRTLVKQGHPKVWGLLGYTKNPKVELSQLRCSAAKVALGDAITFECQLHSRASRKQKLVVDFAVHFMKANGRNQAKVFKLKSFELGPEKPQALAGKISFKPISTRRYYRGQHHIELLVNGLAVGQTSFELV